MYAGFEFGGATEGSSVVLCNVVLVGTWLPLFGESFGSCTTLNIDTVSCSEL
jgi:hypothetical protein